MVGWHAVKRMIDNFDAFWTYFSLPGAYKKVPGKPRGTWFLQLRRITIYFFRYFSENNISSQLLLVSDAMGPNDDSCMDKQKKK